ncbi:MAG: DUF2617 family protein [Pirellulaceae bacterium]|nr:DUF2617 family protein [Pirellulaceae bacterium]
MSLTGCRPRIADMRFRLLGRTVHPELFTTCKCHRVQREHYAAQFCITVDGHYITWCSGKSVLTEVAGASTQPLPESERLLELPLRDREHSSLEVQGCKYTYDYQAEQVASEMFWNIHKQLEQSAHSHELIQLFNSSGRLPIGGLSFIHVESRMRTLSVQVIHTYPEDHLLVRSQSSFTCPAIKT